MSAAVRLLVLSLLGLASCNIHNELQSLNQLKETKAPFTACIDDSDCTEHGTGWACFQYICYPWQDDTKIDVKDRKKTCKTDSHCSSDLSCHRHPDRRNVHKGLCMEPVVDCSENGKSDCNWRNGVGGQECCNGEFCCSPEIFNQLKALPCVDHNGCRTLGYGNFCCPAKENISESSTCCDDYPG